MKKIDISNFKYSMKVDNFIFVVEIKDNEYLIKRIKYEHNIRCIDFIILNSDNVYIKKNMYFDKDKIDINLSIDEKNNIINEIFDVIKEDNILNDVLDIESLLNTINRSFNNYAITDGNLGLSIKNNNYLNIILVDSNDIIGKIDINNIEIFVDDTYFEATLKLFRNYLCLFKKEQYEKVLSLLK